MRRRGYLRSLFALLLATVLASIGALTAKADPLPADYSGSAHGDIVSLDTTLAGVRIGAAIGHSATNVDSTTDPQSEAESANIHANAIGIPVGVSSGSAQADNTTATDSYNVGLGQVDVPGLLDTGVITGSGTANWAGDTQCVTGPIATSTTGLAGADLGGNLLNVINLNILHLGAVQTTSTTALQGGSVVSTSSGNLADATLLNGLVGVHVVTQPTLTATSNGTTGTVTANDYAVQVTIGGTTTTLHAGGSIPINLNLGVATANLTLSIGQLNNTSAGATGSGNMNFISITGTISAALVGTLAQVNVGLLPLSATATAPTGGVECNALDAPVITAPTNGATTGETPTISGTGLPGATITVTENGTTIGTATVDADGNWSLQPDNPLAVGDHAISATQTIG
ncbi:MAG: hypothetical protein J2P17_29435, partial [Mycobacterium sp.]|nr:hypothetical protein [Mycobacterium sp.]